MKQLQNKKDSITNKIKAFFCLNIFKLLYLFKLGFEKIYHFCALNSETKSEHDKKIEEASRYLKKGQNLEKYEEQLVAHIRELQDDNENLSYENKLHKEILKELRVEFQNENYENINKIFKELFDD